MTKKQKVDLSVSLLLIMIGLVFFALPHFNVENISLVMLIVMCLYGLINFYQFMLTKSNKDYEGLYTSILCLATGIAGYFLKLFLSTINLVTILLSWVILMSLIKLKKSDYYNDRKNKMWIIRIFLLILFIISGIVTSLNLNHSVSIKFLVLGYFFFIHGILELVDPITNYLMGNK